MGNTKYELTLDVWKPQTCLLTYNIFVRFDSSVWGREQFYFRNYRFHPSSSVFIGLLFLSCSTFFLSFIWDILLHSSASSYFVFSFLPSFLAFFSTFYFRRRFSTFPSLPRIHCVIFYFILFFEYLKSYIRRHISSFLLCEGGRWQSFSHLFFSASYFNKLSVPLKFFLSYRFDLVPSFSLFSYIILTLFGLLGRCIMNEIETNLIQIHYPHLISGEVLTNSAGLVCWADAWPVTNAMDCGTLA